MTTPPRTSEMSPRDRSPVRTSSPRHPSGKDPWNQWTTYTLTLLQLEQTTDSSGRRGTGPPTEPGFSQGFFSILSPMEFLFLAAVASGLLSWGHFISSTIIDLIAQILFIMNQNATTTSNKLNKGARVEDGWRTKHLVCMCARVCVCVQSFQRDLQHITWCSLQVCPPQQMQGLTVLSFLSCAPLACPPLHS